MSLEWFQEIRFSDEISQGDLIPECLLPRPTAGFYEDLLANNDEPAEAIDIQKADVVVMSQACDIENDKIESIRQGKEPPYHVVDRYQSADITSGFQIVDFHQIYSVPKDYLQQLASRKPVRLRLNPPYREHLSQAFARYFMRVGLPSDIDRQELRNAAKRDK